MRRTGLLLAILALALGLAACGDDDSESAGESEEAATIEIDGEQANYHETVAATGDPIEFEEDDYYFEPTVITGDAGQQVELEITNEGDEEHNLTIEDQDIDEDTEPGDSATVEVAIPDDGLIEFFCEYHTSQNMRGALAVTGSEPTPSSESETTQSGGGGYGGGGY